MICKDFPEFIAPVMDITDRSDRCDALSVVNDEEDTPIHILGREHHLVFLSVARQVPADRLGCLLSLQNADGNTAVHELAHHDASLVFTELMTLMGTQSSMQIISIRNKQGATAFILPVLYKDKTLLQQ